MTADLVFGNHFEQAADERLFVTSRYTCANFRYPPMHRRVWRCGASKDLDFIVISRKDMFRVGDQLLEQLLARAETGKPNFDILVGFEARKPDHVAGQIDNPNRLAHIEDEDFRSLSHNRRL